MGSTNFSLDPQLALFFHKSLNIEIFVETGTFQGKTSQLAATLFPVVHTIEASSKLFEANNDRLKAHTNIRQHLGDSPRILKQIQSEYISKACLFWLDAHWCNAPYTAKIDTECPILEELKSIQNLGDNSVILIDDARLFSEGPPRPHKPEDWPDLLEVSIELSKLSKNHRLNIFDDTLVYAPKHLSADFAEFRDKHTHNKKAKADNTFPEDIHRHALDNKKALLNRDIEKTDHAGVIFSRLLKQNNIGAFLDIGAHKGEFAARMRMYGYSGTIYSLEPISSCHRTLRASATKDPKWIVLPRQAAGCSDAITSINLSENSYSSSLLKVSSEHLEAAPNARIVRTEKCHITKTKNLLSSFIDHHIRAIKIDTQGYEEIVIKGLEESLENIDLIMVEMNAVSCYENCPDMLSLDQLLVKEYGFNRISLEPSFYNEKEPSCQQYDGIYLRKRRGEGNNEAAVTGLPKGVVDTFITSTPGLTSLLEDGESQGRDKWLRLCAESWALIANKTHSVSENNPQLAHVLFTETPTRPSIFDILMQVKALATSRNEQCLLANADIAFTDSFQKLLPFLDKTVVYFGARTDVISQSQSNLYQELGTYSFGYDYFLIPQQFASSLADTWQGFRDFKIGLPWWDYLFPIISLSLGFPTKRICTDRSLALHYKHNTNYSKDLWIERGLSFIEAIRSIDNLRTNHAKALTTEILACFDAKKPTDLHLALTDSSRLILDYF